jgi:hypothetical protein
VRRNRSVVAFKVRRGKEKGKDLPEEDEFVETKLGVEERRNIPVWYSK